MHTPSWRRTLVTVLLIASVVYGSGGAATATEAADPVLRIAVPFSIRDPDPAVAFTDFYGYAQPVTRANLDGEVAIESFLARLAPSTSQPVFWTPTGHIVR